MAKRGIRNAILGALTLAGFAHAQGVEMSVAEARRELKSALATMYRGELNNTWKPMDRMRTYALRNIKVRSDGFEFEFPAEVVTSKMWGTRETLVARMDLRFRDMNPVSVSDDRPSSPPEAWFAGPPDRAGACTRECGNFFWMNRADAERFVRAVNTLIAAARNGTGDDFAEFRAVAAKWRALERKPPLSEEANRHRVLAEAAVRQNDLASAATHYDAALEIFPGWPEGWSNAALVCEARKDFGCAADRIRHYLELVPDAREATAAREKLIVWQEMAKR